MVRKKRVRPFRKFVVEARSDPYSLGLALDNWDIKWKKIEKIKKVV